MDDADRTQERMEIELELRLRNRKTAPELAATGSCHNCDEAVLNDAKFCDEDCRKDFERRQKNRP